MRNNSRLCGKGTRRTLFRCVKTEARPLLPVFGLGFSYRKASVPAAIHLTMPCLMGQAGAGWGREQKGVHISSGRWDSQEEGACLQLVHGSLNLKHPQASWAIYSLTPQTQTVVYSFCKA